MGGKGKGHHQRTRKKKRKTSFKGYYISEGKGKLIPPSRKRGKRSRHLGKAGEEERKTRVWKTVETAVRRSAIEGKKPETGLLERSPEEKKAKLEF